MPNGFAMLERAQFNSPLRRALSVFTVMLLGALALTLASSLLAGIPLHGSVSESTNRFGMSLVKEVSGSEQKNVLISPVGVYIALGALYAGSRGDSKTVLEKGLRYDSGDLDSNVNLVSQLDENLKHEGIVTVANSLWVAPNRQISTDYTATISSKFKMTSAPLKDLGAGGVAQVNDWVNANTGGLIPRLINSLEPSTVLMLLNAIYFDGKWVNPFDKRKTAPGDFHEGSDAYQVQMMHRTSSMDYATADGLQMLRIPYRGDLSMVIALPAEGTDPATALSTLSDPIQFSGTNVELELPKFKFGGEYSLNAALSNLGLESIFHNIDLTGISPSLTSSRTQVSEVFQKTVVDVDEEGTKAAAATGVRVTSSAMPMLRDKTEFHVDHPFAFSIMDDKTGVNLFLGVVRTLKPH